MGESRNFQKSRSQRRRKPRRKRRKLPPEIAKIDVEEFNRKRFVKCQGYELRETILFVIAAINLFFALFKDAGVLTALAQHFASIPEVKTFLFDYLKFSVGDIRFFEIVLSLVLMGLTFNGMVVATLTNGCRKIVDLWEEEAKEVAKLERAMGRRLSEKERIFLMKKLREKYKKGYEEGYDEGYSDGYTAGMW
jgi:hypothetical protein